jgi:hypothetical protein
MEIHATSPLSPLFHSFWQKEQTFDDALSQRPNIPIASTLEASSIEQAMFESFAWDDPHAALLASLIDHPQNGSMVCYNYFQLAGC